MAPAAAGVMLVAFGLAGYAVGKSNRVTEVVPPRSEPARPIEYTASAAASVAQPVVSAPAIDPARVRFVAYPWARVVLEDGSEFYTPRAQPVDLEPGSHRVVFEHPSFGAAEITLELSAGEQRVVRHVFEEAPQP
jgi:hypothetical protein